jgi:hypothetical protein
MSLTSASDTMSNDKKNMNIEEARDLVIAGAKELMKRFREVYNANTNEYRVETSINLRDEEVANKVWGWAESSLVCLTDILRTRLPDLGIYERVMSYVEGVLVLELHVFPLKRSDPFEDIDEHVEDSFC